jgi:hypothetical protein
MTRRLLVCVIKPFVSADWWEKSLDLIERMAGEAPCYEMRFDQSGEIIVRSGNSSRHGKRKYLSIAGCWGIFAAAPSGP